MESKNLTQNGIKKLLNGTFPVTLQVSCLLEKQPDENKLRGTLISEYGDKDTFKRIDEKGYVVPHGVRSFILDDGTLYVENPIEETLEVLPRFYVSDGVHEVQCIVRSNSHNNGNDISVLSGDGYSTIELFSYITVYEAVGSWCNGSTGIVEIDCYSITKDPANQTLIGMPVHLTSATYHKKSTVSEYEELTLTLNWCKAPRTYTGHPGLRLRNGKWILHDGEMTNDEMYSLM